MRGLHATTLVAYLAATALTATLPARGNDAHLVPPDTLILQGVPAIPASTKDAAERYREVRRASFTGWHPERREMLIATRFANTSQVHTVATPGGARRQLTFFAEPVAGGTYRPSSGDSFAFVKDTGGDEFYQIYLFDLVAGRETLLSDGEKRHGGPLWSPAGDRLIYARVDAGEAGAFTELFVAEVGTGASSRVAEMRGGGWSPLDWSADGRTVLALERISANESYLWTLDVGSRQLTEVTPGPRDGSSKISYGGSLLSPDGRWIYTTSDRSSEFRELTRIDATTGEHLSLSAHIPWDVTGFDLSPDGGTIVFVTNEAGASEVRVLDTRTLREKAAPDLPAGVIGAVEIHRNGVDVGFSLTSARVPGDAFSFDLETLEVTRWTHSESGGLDTGSFAEAELVRWKSFDGLEISGFLYRPPATFTGRRPVIVDIHGGPEGQSRPSFRGATNYYINELGIAVIYPNVRGSAGFGKTYIQLDNGFDREASVRDIESLLDWIAERDDLDEERVMITGGSYGGFMTLAVATQYDDRIRCSVDVVGISNLKTFLQNTQGYRRDLRRVEYGDEREPEMAAFLDRIAPMSHAENITKPIFIVQGANDPRVPKSESDQMVATLERIGTPVWYLVGTNEGHGFRKKDNADFQFYATVEFVRRHLLE